MFFVLSKTLGFFASPSNLILAAGLAGVALMATRWARVGKGLAAASLLLLAVAGLSPLGDWLIAPLEDRFPPWHGQEAPAGIVMLGGAIKPDVSIARGAPALNSAAERITTAVELGRRYPDARILYTGGNAGLFAQKGAEADIAARLLEHMGVAPERIIIENKSRNTIENAIYSLPLASPKPGEHWLLVTSAYHMPRSIGIFRRVGFEVEAYPVDWRTAGKDAPLFPFETVAAGLRRTDTAVREWAGLVAYYVTGRTSALFPAP